MENKELSQNIIFLIQEKNNKGIGEILHHLHPADIAEIIENLELEEKNYILELLENELSSAVLLEFDEDVRREILSTFTAKEIAEEVLGEMDSNDAADVLAELSDKKKSEVIAQMTDVDLAKDIVDLLRYDEDTAGGMMAKEYIRVNKDWDVLKCVKEMRRQAEELDEVKTIYVVDDNEVLLGILSLKKLLTTSTRTKLEKLYNEHVHSVSVHVDNEEVANIMSKYDLNEIPVVDELNRLVGCISIDDVIDVIKEEAEKDYQLASGISKDIEAGDNVFELIKARLPWLLIGMVIEIVASFILKDNEKAFTQYATLIIFVPLLSATAGNIGVQASAIVVQGLANGTLNKFNRSYFSKELLVACISGAIISGVIFMYHVLMYGQPLVGFAVSCSLIVVIVFAATLGTLVPLLLHKKKIDPAIATGPFITTTNDVFGILLYFGIARLILGY